MALPLNTNIAQMQQWVNYQTEFRYQLPNQEIVELSALCKLAQRAGDAILEVRHSGQLGLEFKVDQSEVTRADKIANDIITKELEDKYSYKIVAEESSHPDYELRKNQYVWLVDPLDGTKEFVKETGAFTVNIGLCDPDGNPILGVVHAPAKEISYFGAIGFGAYRLDHKTHQITPLKVGEFSELDEKLRMVLSVNFLDDATKEFVTHFKEPQAIQVGSALKFLKIAEDEADLYPRLGMDKSGEGGTTMEWDTCAAHAILRAAGGYIISAENDEELTYNKENLRNPPFVAMGQRKNKE